MYSIMKEITVWPDKTANHTYILDQKGHCVGYFPLHDESNKIMFNVPFKRWSKSYRKFKTTKVETI